MANELIFPTLLTVKQAAEYLTVSDDTIYKLVRQQGIPFIRIGGAIRLPKEKLVEWIEQSVTMTKPTDPPAPTVSSEQKSFSRLNRGAPNIPGYEPIRPVRL